MRKMCVSAFGLLLCVALAVPSLGVGAGNDLASASKSKTKEHGHQHLKPCKHGYVRKHNKCRSTRVPEIASGEWSGPYTTVKVNAEGRTMSIELNGFPCYDPHGEGTYFLETKSGPVSGSITKSAVGAKAHATGGYTESDTYDSRNYTWELTGSFTTRTNFSGTLHIVVDESVSSPTSKAGHCDATEHYDLGFVE